MLGTLKRRAARGGRDGYYTVMVGLDPTISGQWGTDENHDIGALFDTTRLNTDKQDIIVR